MSKRLEQGEVSSIRMIIRLTPTEDARIRGTAWYLGIPYSDLLRQGAEKIRQELVEEGKRPPLRPPAAENGSTEPRGPKPPRR